MVGTAAARGAVEQHVGRLHVPVNQAVGVRRVQRRGHLGDDADHPGRGEGALGVQQRPHVPALHVTHRDEQDTGGLTGLEDRDDVRVVDGRGRSRLTDEPLPERIVAGQLGRQDLQRHPPFQPGVVGAEDNSHPAAANLLLEPVAGYPRARSEPARCRGGLVTHRASSGCLPVPFPHAGLRRSDGRRQDRPGSIAGLPGAHSIRVVGGRLSTRAIGAVWQPMPSLILG